MRVLNSTHRTPTLVVTFHIPRAQGMPGIIKWTLALSASSLFEVQAVPA